MIHGTERVADESFAAEYESRELLLLLLTPLHRSQRDEGGQTVADEESIAAAMGVDVEQVQAVELNAPEDSEQIHNRIHGFMASLFGGALGGEDEDEEPNDNVPVAAEPQPLDEAAVTQLTSMGFSDPAARRALAINQGQPEAAMDWILEHADDPDLDQPLTPEQLLQLQGGNRRGGGPVGGERRFRADEGMTARLVEMGFAPEQVAEALQRTHNNEQAAISFLLGDGGDEIPEEEDEMPMNLLANPMLRALLTNPSVQDGLRNPRVLEAFRAIMEDPQAAPDYLNDPEIGPVLLQVNHILQTDPGVDSEEE